MKPTLAEQWMASHPDDEPCPKSGGAAYHWRVKRGIGGSAAWARTKAERRARERAAAEEKEATTIKDTTGAIVDLDAERARVDELLAAFEAAVSERFTVARGNRLARCDQSTAQGY
jgi:hypothetical protein